MIDLEDREVSVASSRRAATRRLLDVLALSDAFCECPQPVGGVGAVYFAGSNVNSTVGRLWT